MKVKQMSSLKKKILFTGIELGLLYLKIKLEERQDNIQNNKKEDNTKKYKKNRYYREIAKWVRNHENT